jgi:flagellar biosynthetic protein FliR
MSFENALQLVPTFVLVFFRLAGLMIFAPLLGSERIPRVVKIMIALVLAAGMCGSVRAPVALPSGIWETTLGIAGEMAFGLAMGMILSFTFIAAQWAGEMIGQQMGLNISEVIDPEFGQSNSVVSDLYYMLTLTIFLLIGGHREMIRGIRSSFESLPLLSLGVDRPMFDILIGLFQSCTTLAMRLAAPVLVTMLVVDLALGCIGKAMPQMNVMTVGLSVRSMIGLIVIIVGIGLTVAVLSGSLMDAMSFAQVRWATP